MDETHINDDERIIFKTRKHWIIVVRDSIGTAFVGVFPFAIFWAVLALGLVPRMLFDQANLILFAAALWLLVIWMALIVLWTNYYLDIWIVTNRRIFNIEQVTLFQRRVATWGLERVQEITVKNENFMQTLFGYGTIQVETASPTDENAIAEGIPNPDHVRTIMLQEIGRIDQFEETAKRQEKLIHTMADSALSETRKGVSSVMNVLESANPGDGSITIEKKVFDLRAAAQKVTESLRNAAERRGLTIEFIASGGSCNVQGDEKKLSDLVFKNIIENAIHYTPSGSIHVVVTNLGARILFGVKDTGIGLTEADKPRLFVEGGKGARSKANNPNSTGYGLFIAKSIVDAHGGKIWATSDGSKKGALFLVELPAAT